MKKTDRSALIVVAMLAAVGMLSMEIEPAEAAFPGANGKIAFDTELPDTPISTEIYTVGSGGLGLSALTEHTASNVDASFSADGQKVAFASQRGGNWDIYAIDANTPEGSANPAVRLTTGAAHDQQPTFSPDGNRIAFTRFRADGTGSDVYVKNVDGSRSATLLADVAGWEADPEWSPDGGRVAFVSASYASLADAVIYTADTLGVGALLRVTGSGERALQPSWSPDGQQIAYKRLLNDSANSGIYRTPSDGTGPLAVLTGTLLFSSRRSHRPRPFKAASNVVVAEEQTTGPPGPRRCGRTFRTACTHILVRRPGPW